MSLLIHVMNNRYIGRPTSAATATGSFKKHSMEQRDIINKAMSFTTDECAIEDREKFIKK